MEYNNTQKANVYVFDECLVLLNDLVNRLKESKNLREYSNDFLKEINDIELTLFEERFRLDMADLHGIHREYVYVEGLERDLKGIYRLIERDNSIFSKFIKLKFDKNIVMEKLEVIVDKWKQMPIKEKEYLENMKNGINQNVEGLDENLIKYHEQYLIEESEDR